MAGILVGLGFAVKVSDVLVGLGLAIALVIWLRPAWRRLLPVLAALGAGFAATAGAALAIGGSAMLRQLSRESDMVSIGSPWRVIRTVIHLAVTGTAATDIVKFGAIALAVVLAVLLIRGLPGVLPGRGRDPGLGASPEITGTGYPAAGASVVFALVLAWLFAWPYVLPWYDALGWGLLALLPASRLDWLLLTRTTALALGYLPARATGIVIPGGLTWLRTVVRTGVTPVVLLAVTVVLVVLLWRQWRAPAPAPKTAGPGGAARRAARSHGNQLQS